VGIAWFLVLSFPSVYNSPLGFQKSAQAEDILKHHVEAARQAQIAHDLPRAVEEYKKALSLAPESAELYQNLGLVYHLQSDYRDAITAFERALKIHPDLWVSNLFLGMGYFKTNRFSEALPVLHKALDRGPKQAELEGRLWLGITYMVLGRYEEAVSELEKRAELAPLDIDVLFSLAEAHGRYATFLYDRLLKSYSESARAFQFQGDQAQSAEKPEEAIQAYEQAASRQPDLEGIYLNMGAACLQLGQLSRAAQCFENELRFNPYDTRARQQLALISHSLDSPPPTFQTSQISEEYATKAAANDRRHLFLSGISDFHAGRWKEAAGHFEAVLNLEPEDQRAKLYLARCRVRLNVGWTATDSSQSIAGKQSQDPEYLYALGDIHSYLSSVSLGRAVAIEPNSYRVHQITGEKYEREGQYSKALEAYKTALTIKSDLPGIRFAIGSIYWKTRQFDEAAEWLRKELKDNPHHALANYELANIFLHNGEPSEAVTRLKETLFARPDFMEAHRDMAAALVQLQRYDEAVEHLKLAAKAAPEAPAVHALLANVYRKQGKREEEKAELVLYQQLNEEEHERVRRKFSELNELMDRYKPNQDSVKSAEGNAVNPNGDAPKD
jgi:tetratricopeptide (TPR) repeat protein